MSKVIPVETVFNIASKAVQTPAKDEDGEIKWKEKPVGNVPGIPELCEANTKDLIETTIFSIPRAIVTNLDALRVTQVWHRIDAADGSIELHDKLYDWLHRLLKRDIPVSAEEKELGDVKPIPYAQFLWGMSAPVIIEQIKVPEERKNLDDLELS